MAKEENKLSSKCPSTNFTSSCKFVLMPGFWFMTSFVARQASSLEFAFLTKRLYYASDWPGGHL